MNEAQHRLSLQLTRDAPVDVFLDRVQLREGLRLDRGEDALRLVRSSGAPILRLDRRGEGAFLVCVWPADQRAILCAAGRLPVRTARLALIGRDARAGALSAWWAPTPGPERTTRDMLSPRHGLRIAARYGEEAGLPYLTATLAPAVGCDPLDAGALERFLDETIADVRAARAGTDPVSRLLGEVGSMSSRADAES